MNRSPREDGECRAGGVICAGVAVGGEMAFTALGSGGGSFHSFVLFS